MRKTQLERLSRKLPVQGEGRYKAVETLQGLPVDLYVSESESGRSSSSLAKWLDWSQVMVQVMARPVPFTIPGKNSSPAVS